MEICRGRSRDSSLGPNVSVDVQFLGRRDVSDAHVAVRKDGEIGNPADAVVVGKIDFTRISVHRTRPDVHSSAPVVGARHRVRAVQVHEPSSVARRFVRYEEESGGRSTPPVPSGERSVHRDVARDVQLVWRRGRSANPHDVVREIQNRKFAIERLQRRDHLVPFGSRKLARARRCGGRIAGDVGRITYGQCSESSEERGCPECRSFDF